ncbi:MAG: hypothetical protein GC201_04265 [Alphaproteobacteria bacterium]|nr:hypothetical protein [Alphaproteobacteria bacterium]
MDSYVEILERSRAFFEDVLLPRIADYMPLSVEPTEEMHRLANRALGAGFTSAVMFPSVKRQMLDFHLGVIQMLTEPLEGMSATGQYTEPLVDAVDSFKQAGTLNRPDGPYCLFMLSGAFPAETKGHSPNDLRPLFASRGWVSLTAFEYMAIQRMRAARTLDHGFDRNGPMGQPMWLLDTLGEDGRSAYAYWDVETHGIHLGFSDSDAGREGFGAHPAMVVAVPDD